MWSWLRRRFHLDEDDFAEELRSHLALAESAGDDRDAARKQLGNLTLATEDARRIWLPRWLETLLDIAADVRLAFRSLAKSPAFALTVIAVLTIGIGVNASVFTMLKSMALSPLSGVERSATLAVVYGLTSAGRDVRLSYPDYRRLRTQAKSFSSLMATGLIAPHLGRGRHARQIYAEFVSGNYFSTLGVHPQLGRLFDERDERAPGQHPYVVLSDRLWRSEFHADPSLIGRTIELNHFPLTVIGVASASFHGTIVSYDVEAFVPLLMTRQLGYSLNPDDERAAFLFPHGWLSPNATLASAQSELDALWTQFARTRPADEPTRRLEAVRFWRSPSGAQTYLLPLLSVLAVMGLLVLLIACANIAGLILVRGFARRGEIAVRLALGASRARLVRLLVIENLVLAIPGALLGVALAYRTLPIFTNYAERLADPNRLFFNIEVDGLVLGYAALAACLSALLFGLAPAWRSTRLDLVSVINEDASPRGAGRGRLRTALVVAQVAVSLALLAGSGLVSRSLEHARQADPGFQRERSVVVSLDLEQNAYTAKTGPAFARKLLAAARAHPAVESASLATYVPLSFLDTREQRITIDGYQPARRDEDLAFLENAVGPDYFSTLGIPLLAGRAFEDRDHETAAPAAIVNRAFAQRYWGGAQSALGRRIKVANGEWRAIIGVAADVKYARIDEAPRPYVYQPWFQSYRPALNLHLRGAITADQARALVTSLDGDLPLLGARPLSSATRGAFIFFEFASFMLLVFGVAGMVLAALGTYGLVSYTVKQSGREIGIRLALGATAAAVVRNFLARGLRLGLLGAALGIVVAFAAGRLLGGFLFGITATDPSSYATALALVVGGVLLATLVPACRAARTNAVDALRQR